MHKKVIFPPPGLFSSSIWSSATPSPDELSSRVSQSVKISIEGIPCIKYYQVLDELKNDLPVYNRNRTWLRLYNNKREEHTFSYFLHQMTENSQKQISNEKGFRLHNGLYSLNSIWFDWLNQEKLVTGGQDQLLRNCSAHLLDAPDYIIYLHSSLRDLFKPDSHNKSYSVAQIKNLYECYEMVLDNTHCPYPLFKINLQDNTEHIVATVKAILRQITERLELEIDHISD